MYDVNSQLKFSRKCYPFLISITKAKNSGKNIKIRKTFIYRLVYIRDKGEKMTKKTKNKTEKKLKCEKFVVYVYGRPEGSNASPVVRLVKLGKDGKREKEIGLYGPNNPHEFGYDLYKESKQVKDYHKSKIKKEK